MTTLAYQLLLLQLTGLIRNAPSTEPSITNHMTRFNLPVYQPGLTDGIAMLLPAAEHEAIEHEGLRTGRSGGEY